MGSAFSFLKVKTLQDSVAGVEDKDTVDSINSQIGSFRILAIVMGILAALYLMMVCCSFRSLRIAINVVDAAADFLSATKRLIFVPLVYSAVSIAVCAVWFICWISVDSQQYTDVRGSDLVPQAKIFSYSKDGELRNKVFYMSLFMLFGIFWIVNFIKAKTDFIAMVTAATFYFNSTPEAQGSANVM